MKRLPNLPQSAHLLPAIGAIVLLLAPGGAAPVEAQAVVAPEAKQTGGKETPSPSSPKSAQTAPSSKKPKKESGPQGASKKPAQSSATKSLDDELLGELSEGLFGPVEDELFRQGVQKPKQPAPANQSGSKASSPAKPAGRPKSAPADPYPELDQPEGEDIGPQDNPLASISRQMQQVQRKLASKQLDDQTLQMQQEIVRRLEKLLKQSRRNSSSRGGASRPSSGSRSGSRRQQAKLPSGTQSQGGQPQGQQAARRANPQAEQTQEKGPRPPKAEEEKRNLVQDLIKRIWGHLPPRMRQQMLQSATDRFLPQYQLEIEEYFKRVSRARSEEP